MRETLRIACDLRLPSTTSHQERNEIVDDLILELGLKSCADVLIGDAYASESGTGGTRGISGGERRRVSAALQLLTSPSLLICDEVTSGMCHSSDLLQCRFSDIGGLRYDMLKMI